jgi:hypothetical protein
MNSDYEKRLEAEIARAIKALPELDAPRTLLPRILAAVEKRAASRWYRRSWQEWPPIWRAFTLVGLLAAFAGLCLAGWELQQLRGWSLLAQEAGDLFSGIGAVYNALNVLGGAVVLVLKQFGTSTVVLCVAAAGLSYALCVAVGTACVRFAFVRHTDKIRFEL